MKCPLRTRQFSGYSHDRFAKPQTVVKCLKQVMMRLFRPARGARIETRYVRPSTDSPFRFAPHAGRGLKHNHHRNHRRLRDGFAPHAGRGLKRLRQVN